MLLVFEDELLDADAGARRTERGDLFLIALNALGYAQASGFRVKVLYLIGRPVRSRMIALESAAALALNLGNHCHF